MRSLCILFLLLFALQVEAQEGKVTAISLEPIASERVILTVNTPGGPVTYSHPQIEAIGLKQLVTSTYWPEDNGEYDGVLLRDLLSHAGLENSNQIKLTALDDYSAVIPKKDWQQWDVLVATRHDKKVMPIRKKGPLRIIYPKDIGGEIAATDMRIRWIWAIKSIEPVL